MERRVIKMKKIKQSADGLRVRKKDDRRILLLKVAASLFRRVGYETTRMEDIAVAAKVSTKTVYNYFTNKRSLLIGYLEQDRESMVSAYEKIIAYPSKGPAETLARLVHADIGEVKSGSDKKLWRELLAAETRAHRSADDDFAANRKVFLEVIKRALLHFQKSGQLSRTLPLPIAIEMIYAISAHNFRQYCAIDELTPKDILRTAKIQMTYLVGNWLNTARQNTGVGSAAPKDFELQKQ
jgi:AcrR family transcriptional regulator